MQTLSIEQGLSTGLWTVVLGHSEVMLAGERAVTYLSGRDKNQVLMHVVVAHGTLLHGTFLWTRNTGPVVIT
jgi:hypothetical protein